jgi:hypothetical protein
LVLFAAPLEAILYLSAFAMMRRYRISRQKHGRNVEATANI